MHGAFEGRLGELDGLAQSQGSQQVSLAVQHRMVHRPLARDLLVVVTSETGCTV